MAVNAATTLGIPRADLDGSISLMPLSFTLLHDTIFPSFEVPLDNGSLGFLDAAASLPRLETGMVRATGGNYPTMNWTLKGKSYQTVDYGIQQPIDNLQQAKYANTADLEEVAAYQARVWALAKSENDWIGKLFNITTFPLSGTTGVDSSSTPWSNRSTGDAIGDCNLAIAGIQARSGLRPNACIMSDQNWRYCWMQDKVRDNVKYVIGTDIPDPGDLAARKALAAILGVKMVYVSDFFYNSAIEGQAFSGARMVSNTYVFWCRIPENPANILEPCIGRTFYWNPPNIAGGGLGGSWSYPTPPRHQMVGYSRFVDINLLCAELGFLTKVG